MIPVVMSGGSGTRLWPVSRMKLPKQFCDLFGEPLQTLTLKRLSPLGAPWVITSEVLRELTELNAKSSGQKMGQMIYEPQGKNTAAAIALICRVFELQGMQDEVVGIFPADHLVTKENQFQSAIRFAETLAADGKVITLGIRPHHPETGFGYIQTEKKPIREEGALKAFPVMRFHEKPNLEKAQEFLADGNYNWNAGIFVFRSSVMSNLLKQHEPDVWQPLQALKKDLSNLRDIYATVKSISIDYAVMEKIGGTGLLTCLPVDIGWSDVGSWDAVAEEAAVRNEEHNPSVHLIDSKNVYLHSPGEKVVAVIGLSDIQIVDTGDVLLVSKKGESQKVRQVVDSLTKSKDSRLVEPPVVQGVWGSIENLKSGQSFNSRLITVQAKSQTPEWEKGDFQWTILQGSGELLMGTERMSVQAGMHLRSSSEKASIFSNESNLPMVILEVQIK